MLNLTHTRTFLAVVEARGFRAAARALAVSPSTVVEHLRLLEADLAATLVLRRRGEVAPTAAGLAFLPLARALVETAQTARRVVAGTPLRIAAASNVGVYLLHDVLAGFRRREEVPTELWVCGNPEVADRLASGRADVGLMEWWDDRPGFRARAWRRERLVVIVAPGHRLADAPAITLDDLFAETVLGGEPGTGTGTLLRRALGPEVARLRMVSGFGSTEAVKRAVRAGLGVSIVLASAVADEVSASHLVARDIAGTDLVKDIRLVLPDPLAETAPAARFAAYAIGPEAR